MGDEARPYLADMLREAIGALGGSGTNVEVRDWVLSKYPGTNPNSVSGEIISRTVNHPSRVHFPTNQRPRIANHERLDFLYRPERGRLELYDPGRHGQYQITEGEDGSFSVGLAEEPGEDGKPPDPETFALESHLRDFLARRLHVLEDGLELFVDDGGRTGVEYTTPVGRIDILAKDRDERFVVIELKVRESPDKAAGQLMRYRNWVALHLDERQAGVRSCLVAARISIELMYALAHVPDLMLREYALEIRLRDVSAMELNDRGGAVR